MNYNDSRGMDDRKYTLLTCHSHGMNYDVRVSHLLVIENEWTTTYTCLMVHAFHLFIHRES